MSKAWVSRETIDPTTGKRKREKMPPGLAGVGPTDSFVVFYLAPPDNRQKQERIGILGRPGKRAADRRADEITAQLVSGTFEAKNRQTWQDFRAEYDALLARSEPSTRQLTRITFQHFERICKPKAMAGITSQMLHKYVSKRLTERGKRKGTTVSKATVNKELRMLRAALRKAHKWKYLPEVPDIPFERETETIKPYVLPEDFEKLYTGADHAKRPELANIPAADWWRALFVTLDLTGWRIGQLLALKWADVDLDGGFIITRGDDNKGKRDSFIAIHPLVVEHLRPLQASFERIVFPWPHSLRELWTCFHKLQCDAGVKPAEWMQKEHYSFHDFRRGFATKNSHLDGPTLQHAMQHRDFSTTLRYINMARQLANFTDKLVLPKLPSKESVG